MREKNLGFIFWLAVFTCCFSLSNSEEDAKSRQTFVIRYKDGEQTIPVTVVLDYKKQTEYVINMNPRTPAKSVTLYDFKQRTIAYKDLANKECFLGRLTHETMYEESSALQDVKNPVEVKPKLRSLDPRMPALTPTEIRNIAGQKTAVFCRKMNTWLLMPEKTHSISKREVDEVEERTLQYHGHRSSQYSHYERETRRRFRNRNHANLRRRSRTREGVAENENGGLAVTESSILPLHLKNHSSNGVSFNPSRLDRIISGSTQNHSSNNPTLSSSSSESNVEDGKENSSNGNSFTITGPFSRSNISHNHFRHPYSENSFSSESGVPVYSRQKYFNLNDTDGAATLQREIISGSSSNAVNSFEENNSLAQLTSDDTDRGIEIQTTTTESPLVSSQHGASHPNVHSSLVHLLPLYKPLSQEFEFNQETRTGNQSNSQKSNQQRNIESEIHPLPPTLIGTNSKFIHDADHGVSHDPDVSVNVLEIPRITKEFENIQNNISRVSMSQPENHVMIDNPADSYPAPSETSSNSSSYVYRNDPYNTSNTFLGRISNNVNRNNAAEDTYFNENNIHSKVPTTTSKPILTTREYFVHERTTPDNLYVPFVHTAFQNLEDFNSFQIFPDFIENSVIPLPTDTNSSVNAIQDHKFTDVNADRTPQHLVLTTEYPVVKQKYNSGSNHRSDIPSEDTNGQSSLFDHMADPLGANDRVANGFPSHKIRYQNVLRDFKPDEIVIDIENIPTHTPPPLTTTFRQRILTTIHPTIRSLPTERLRNEADKRSELISGTTWRRQKIPTTIPPTIGSLSTERVRSDADRRSEQISGTAWRHQRIPTTIRPTIESLSTESVRIDADRRSEQISGTTWRNFAPTTRFPRRRINDKPRRPIQSGLIPSPQRSSLNQNRHQLPPPQFNQLIGVNQLNSRYPTNRRQFHYRSRPVPPSNVLDSPERNQIHHISHLNNLPPGVSIHPRHPQAPLADMVHSNRPPTIPILSDNQEYPKPHRQRHHRKKDRHLNSCCRLRGKSGAFQSCCRNGGPCCSRGHTRMQPPGSSCCSPAKTNGHISPANQIQPPVRTTNKILPSIRTEETHRSEVDNKNRCQKEKMCRTLYESTQQVMVCRNAHIEGCR